MSDLVVQASTKALLPLPAPKHPIEISPATLNDVAWIDSMQKKQRDKVGWQSFGAIEGKVEAGEIIVARATREDVMRDAGADADLISYHASRITSPVGYCMAADRYMKHEDVGIVYQMNVDTSRQRQFIAAALLKAQFERSAYGCKLYCCWCAQDIAANRFWEAMGFSALAYRAGSQSKKGGRVHIFWQKRIRENDRTTPWWFPSETKGGSMANRLVLPIPPGTHWSEVQAVVLPALSAGEAPGEEPVARASRPRASKEKDLAGETPAPQMTPKRLPLSGGMSFAPPAVKPAPTPVATEPVKEVREKKPRVKAKNDPQQVAAARELRDRWLEHVNSQAAMLEGAGKYDVGRALESSCVGVLLGKSEKLLTAA